MLMGPEWGLVEDLQGLLGDKAVPLGHWDIVLEIGKNEVDVGAQRRMRKSRKAKWDRPKRKIDDGLVRFNPNELARSNASHPIIKLMEEAQAAWVEKNSRQSKTLKAAVEEYERRHGRAPPKGFEKWWKYVKWVLPFRVHPLLPLVRRKSSLPD
jgi:hypothetical protein